MQKQLTNILFFQGNPDVDLLIYNNKCIGNIFFKSNQVFMIEIDDCWINNLTDLIIDRYVKFKNWNTIKMTIKEDEWDFYKTLGFQKICDVNDNFLTICLQSNKNKLK